MTRRRVAATISVTRPVKCDVSDVSDEEDRAALRVLKELRGQVY